MSYLPTLLATALLIMSNSAYAEFNPTCQMKVKEKKWIPAEQKEDGKGEWVEVEVEVIKNRRGSLDVERPVNPKVNKEAIYDASKSTTPSGEITYKWKVEMGNTKFIGPDDQVTLKVIATPVPPNKGVSSYIYATIYDPVCQTSESARIVVDYYPD